MKKKILIEGMSCGHCVNHVYEALDEIRVTDIKVNLEQGNAIAEVGDITDDTIKAAIEEVGYDVIGIEEA